MSSVPLAKVIVPFEVAPLWVAVLVPSLMVAVKLDCVIVLGIVGVTEVIEMLPAALQRTLIEPVVGLPVPDAVFNVLLAILYPNVPDVFVASLNKQVSGTSSAIVTVAVSAEAFEATPRELTKVNVARAKERRKFLSMDLVDKD
jgi:hypothetical protein